MLLEALAALAIVVQDQAALRAAPQKAAQQQAVLWQGDALEIRGVRRDYLQVYDHRRERAGYVLASQVRSVSPAPEAAAELLSVVRFLRDGSGSEAVGIAYTAAYLKAAPAREIGAEAFDALGGMAERLARRASGANEKPNDARLAAHLEVAAHYGVGFTSVERDGRVQLCYDGDAYQRVLSMQADEEQRARAVLGLTRHECVDPLLRPFERRAVDRQRLERLDGIDVAQLPPSLRNRVLMRRAGVLAAVAFQRQREGEGDAGLAARAIAELSRVDRAELTDDDQRAWTDGALRVGAVRWAAEAVPARRKGLGIRTQPGEPGQTCVLLVDDQHDAAHALARRCTYGQVWSASARPSPDSRALALAVQPLDTWRELWVFRRDGAGWSVDVLPPDASDPDLGYAEFAGWVPGGRRLLVAREARAGLTWKRSFEVVRIDSLVTEKKADEPANLSTFYQWQAPDWKASTLALR